jgi:hypothetical protein
LVTEVSDWLYNEFVASGKLPLILCFVSFILTFAVTRISTRMIRAGKGPFRDNVTSGGVHIHHAVYGVVLLTSGAVLALGAQTVGWRSCAGVLVGVGMSLVLDEFALILHLQDVYWSQQGRLSVDAISLTGAVLLLALIGVTPLGVADSSDGEVTTRLGVAVALLVHGALLALCLTKGKYGTALFGLFVPIALLVGLLRLARPRSLWARQFYSEEKTVRAVERASSFDARWQKRRDWWTNLIGGRPNEDAGSHSSRENQ